MILLTDSTTLFEFVRTLEHLLRAMPIDDNSVSVLAMLIGIVGGWTLTGLRQQVKAKRVKLQGEERKREPPFRKPD